jgi:ribosomal protein S6--L-glutamate ligase
MNIVILSRGPNLYSTQSLCAAARQRGHQVRVVDHTGCSLFMEKGQLKISYNGQYLEDVDAIIPRIGSSVTFQGAAVIQHFELMQVFTVARSYALLQARDKLRCMQKLASYGIDVPRSIFVGQGQDIEKLVEKVGGYPIIIKITESTHGSGVLLADSYNSASGIIEAFHRLKEKVMIQEFVKESAGTDLRVLVVAGQVVAAMKREAQKGEFRSNLHRGAQAITESITARERELAVKATQIMGLDVAGVDLLRSSRGPLVLEVNASPGLEGIENTTGVDVAGKIISFIERRRK